MFFSLKGSNPWVGFAIVQKILSIHNFGRKTVTEMYKSHCQKMILN